MTEVPYIELQRADERLGRTLRELIHQASQAGDTEVVVGWDAGLYSVSATRTCIQSGGFDEIELTDQPDLAGACDTVADRLARDDWD